MGLGDIHKKVNQEELSHVTKDDDSRNVTKKSPLLAAIISVFFSWMGMGYLYLGKWRRAGLSILVVWISFFFVAAIDGPALIIWFVWFVIISDSYYQAVKSNREYGLSKKQEKVEKGFDSKTQVGEYKRRCNQCGKIWHSLVSREKELEGNVKFNAFIQFGTAIGGNLSAATQSKRNVESNQDILDKMRQCPNCGSRNYSEDILTYEKR